MICQMGKMVLEDSISSVDGGGLRSIRVAELEVGDWVKVELGVGSFFSHSHTEGVDVIEFFGLVERVKCLGGVDVGTDYAGTNYWMVIFRPDVKVCFYADDELLLMGRFKRELGRGR